METTKSDEQIVADFMGINVRYHGPVLYRCDEDGYTDFVDGADTYSPNLDWSDLMPVVEKIHNIEGLTSMVDEYADVITLPIYTPIEEVYKAAVEFIKWYNQQTGTPKEL